MGTTRFGPILRSGKGVGMGWFADQPIGSSPDYIEFWDDFTGIAVNTTNDWTSVKDSSATVAIVADTHGGELALTSAATTDNDGASIQGNEIFLPASGRKIWFEARVKVADADQQDVFVGLCGNFATDPEACLAASNRIGLQIDDGNASILCKSEATDTETSTDSGIDAADATYVRVGFIVNGTTNIKYFVNRQLVATHTTNIPATELAPAVFSLSGNNQGTKSLTIDYIRVVSTR